MKMMIKNINVLKLAKDKQYVLKNLKGKGIVVYFLLKMKMEIIKNLVMVQYVKFVQILK